METKVMCLEKSISACDQMLMMQWGSHLPLYTMIQCHRTCTSGQSQDSGELSPLSFSLNSGGVDGICGRDWKNTSDRCSPSMVNNYGKNWAAQPSTDLLAPFALRCGHITGSC